MTVSLSYHAMRMAGCREALKRFVRRWGLYFVVAAAIFGAGSGSPLAAVAGLAGWTVVPLAQAVAGASAGRALAMLLVQAAVGLALLWGARALLWPLAWREAERALPLAPRVLRRSDTVVVALALAPWGLLQAAGAASLLAARPAWLWPVWPLFLFALVLAQGLAGAGGVALLQWLRRVPAAPWPATPVVAAALRAPLRPGWVWPMFVLPLWRGPARRSGAWLAGGTLALLVPVAALVAWPQAAGWWLAALSTLALVVITRLAGLARMEFAPLLAAAGALPLPTARLERARQVLALMPLAVSWLLAGPAALALALGLGLSLPLRPAVLAAWAGATLASCAWEAASPPAPAADKASRWLFCLVLCLALASEVLQR